MTPAYDVAVVGFGPVGATLANLLGLCGVSTVVLDREAEVYHLPRAVHFDDEVMRIFQAIGIAEDMAAQTMVGVGMRFVDGAGNLLLDWPRPQAVGPQGWHASYRFHQPDLERTLRAALVRRPTVRLRPRVEVRDVVDRGDHAALACTDLEAGRDETLTAAYVVGCDGARSLVRRCIGSGLHDLGFHERWLVLDAVLTADKPALGDYSVQYCEPARPSTYVRGPGDRRRWEITVLDHESDAEITAPDRIWQLLARWLAPHEATVERAAVYTFHSTIAERWRQGRLLLAGDSAHQTPPFMGQGMCAGMRDAANLAWKLALTVRGEADDALLDSYQSERYPHVQAYIETAVRLGGLINASGTEAALRAALRTPEGPARMETIAVRLGPGLAAGDATHAGRLFPQPRLAEGRHADTRAGYGMALYAEAGFVAAAPPGVALITTDDAPDLAATLDRFEARAAVVRADRYVLGTARTAGERDGLLAAAGRRDARG